MKNKEKIINFMMKIKSEGVAYYFQHYSSPESVEEDATEAGLDPGIVTQLVNVSKLYEQASRQLDAVQEAIEEIHGIEEEDYEY